MTETASPAFLSASFHPNALIVRHGFILNHDEDGDGAARVLYREETRSLSS